MCTPGWGDLALPPDPPGRPLREPRPGVTLEVNGCDSSPRGACGDRTLPACEIRHRERLPTSTSPGAQRWRESSLDLDHGFAARGIAASAAYLQGNSQPPAPGWETDARRPLRVERDEGWWCAEVWGLSRRSAHPLDTPDAELTECVVRRVVAAYDGCRLRTTRNAGAGVPSGLTRRDGGLSWRAVRCTSPYRHHELRPSTGKGFAPRAVSRCRCRCREMPTPGADITFDTYLLPPPLAAPRSPRGCRCCRAAGG